MTISLAAKREKKVKDDEDDSDKDDKSDSKKDGKSDDEADDESDSEDDDKSDTDAIRITGNQVTIVKSGGVGTIITITATGIDDCGNKTVTQFVVKVVRRGNEGVGNGEDENTPGHDNNGGNDDPQFSPGNPGAKNKK